LNIEGYKDCHKAIESLGG